MESSLSEFFQRDEAERRLKEGVAAWNQWRAAHPEMNPDLSDADLEGIDLGCPYKDPDSENSYEENERAINLNSVLLMGTNLRGANLSGANLSAAKLMDADLSGANLDRATLSGADFEGATLNGATARWANAPHVYMVGTKLTSAKLEYADLRGSDLSLAHCEQAIVTGAWLSFCDLTNADFTDAELRGAHLNYARLVETKLSGADLTGAFVYGIAAWNLNLENAVQFDLVITPQGEPEITVDSIEIAQFVYLLVNNERIREAIDTLGRKCVLLLGRFRGPGWDVLQILKSALRARGLVPILFTFGPEDRKSRLDTVETLALLSRMVVADITDPRAVIGELARIEKHMARVPVEIIIKETEKPDAMLDGVLSAGAAMHRFLDVSHLVDLLDTAMLPRAEEKSAEAIRKLQEFRAIGQ
ncbi:MAG: pentapeptide repeat-containing protein [Bryobacteraceae bacterium]